jgi:hypothetical protein
VVHCWWKNETQESGAVDKHRVLCEDWYKSASEPLALLTLAYGEYTTKKLSVFEWHMQFT